MKLHLLSTTCLHIARSALATEFQQATGRALRRTGMLPALALLACLRASQNESWTGPRQALPTLLLWHTRSVIAEEATPLLRMMIEDEEALMPYDFLASQPALMGVNLQLLFPELSQAICLPWVDEAGADIWQRSLLLAAHALHEQPRQRVICLLLDRDASHLQAQALSLTLDAAGPRALATVKVSTTASSSSAPPAADFLPCLSHWVGANDPSELQLDSHTITVRASLKSPH